MNTKKTKLLLPHELMVEILLRLPVKSLIRFKSISKPWHSLILDTHFTKSHFDLAAAPTNTLLYMTASGSEVRWVDVDTSICCDYAVVQLAVPRHDFLMVMGSCRGFILLENYPNLILWNPSTGVRKLLSYSPMASNVPKNDTFRYSYFWGSLGYDTCSNDYLVVIGWHGDVGLVKVKPYMEFFTVKGNSWKEIEGIDFPYMISFAEPGVLFNGAIHWLATKLGRAQAPESEVIIAFDLVGKKFSEIPLPNIPGNYFFCLRMLGEFLGVCCSDLNQAELRVMKEYNVQSSWSKLNVLLPYNFHRCTLICFTKGGELVAPNSHGHLLKIDGEGLVERKLDTLDTATMVMFHESLLSLPDDFAEAREDGPNNRQEE